MGDELRAWLDGFISDPSFLERYPYYAAIVAKLSPVADPSVRRMAVSLYGGRFFLHVNVDSFLSEPQYLRGVLLHEVHHVVLGHLAHPKFANATEPELMDIAIESSANEYIEEALPNPIVWRTYSAFGLRPGQSTIERYEILVDHVRKTGARPRPRPSDGGDPNATTVDDHRYLRSPAPIPGGVTQTSMLIERAMKDAPEIPIKDRPRTPEDEPDVPRRYKVAGRLPGRWIEELEGTTLPPEHWIDWKSALSMFVARARAPVHTWARPNRRFPDRVFAVPGRTWAPRRVNDPRLLVAIDTSVSMSNRELEEIARQLVLLAERAHVTVVECDVEITRVYPFAGKIECVTGRGGTDLRPVFAPDTLAAFDVDGVVYFTDGDGPYPEEPARVPTLWILTKPQVFECPWGERARLGRGMAIFR